MPIESLKQLPRTLLFDLLLLLFITPFLLFPSVSAAGTAVSLLLLLLIWLAPPTLTAWLKLPHTSLNTAVFWLLFMTGIGILVTADPELTLPKATGILLGVTVWRVVALHATTHPYVVGGTAVFVLMGLGFTLLGVLNANWLFKIPGIQEIVARIPQAVIVVPESPDEGVQTNQIASTILIWLPLLISLFLAHWQIPWRKWVFVGGTAVLLIGTFLLILTQSRSGYIGFLGGGFLLCLLWRQQLRVGERLRHWLTAMLSVGSVMGGGFLLYLGPERVGAIWRAPAQDTLVGNLGTIGFRQEVWRWSLQAFQDFFFTGTGLGTFRVVVRRLYPITIEPGYDIAHAHNIFLQTGLDLGIVGLLAYVAMLIMVGVMAWRVGRVDQSKRPFALGLLGGIIALHLFGLTDALALGAKPGLLLWLAFGLITAMYLHHAPPLAK